MTRITSIIFDLDGTLYSSNELVTEITNRIAEGIALQLGIAVPDAVNRLTAKRNDLTANSGREATLSATCAELGCDIMAIHRYLAENVVPERYLARDDRVVAMLRRLGVLHNLYIYTNNNRILAGKIMRAIGVDETFTEIFTIEDFRRAKPDRLALARLFAAIGAEPVECLFVGDRYDIDLRLPEDHGSRVFLTSSTEQLLSLEEFCIQGE